MEIQERSEMGARETPMGDTGDSGERRMEIQGDAERPMGEQDDPGTTQGIWAKIWEIRGRYMGMADAKKIQRDSWEI
jgi:hypothetical protein